MSDKPNAIANAGESRASFLARVREPLGRKATLTPREPAPEVDESLVRLASSEDDLVAMFCLRAEEVGFVVHRVNTEDAVARLVGLLGEHELKSVVIATGASGEPLRDDETSMHDAVANAGVEVIDGQSAPGLDVQFDLGAGISDVHAALAETGTLICSVDASHSRGPSLIPPHHIALVRKQDILPDMIDFWQRYAGLPPEERPSSIALITGPSKTADIEGQLIQGVHGPGRVDVFVIE
ncbi:MAG: lactate utilization protein [Rhodospirillales bacterium]|nr:lactate utilization protein [Rhodospirillales bacterium]